MNANEAKTLREVMAILEAAAAERERVVEKLLKAAKRVRDGLDAGEHPGKFAAILDEAIGSGWEQIAPKSTASDAERWYAALRKIANLGPSEAELEARSDYDDMDGAETYGMMQGLNDCAKIARDAIAGDKASPVDLCRNCGGSRGENWTCDCEKENDR